MLNQLYRWVWYTQTFLEKTFADSSQSAKIVKVFSLESFTLHRRRKMLKVRGAKNFIAREVRAKISRPCPFLRDLARPLTLSQCSQEFLDERTTVSQVQEIWLLSTYSHIDSQSSIVKFRKSVSLLY